MRVPYIFIKAGIAALILFLAGCVGNEPLDPVAPEENQPVVVEEVPKAPTEASETSEATETPAATSEDVVPETTKNTEEETVEPSVPEETVEPKVTTVPEETVEPEETVVPEEKTVEPEEKTVEPEVTVESVIQEEPQTPEIPVVPEPEVVQEPEVVPEPEVIPDPGVDLSLKNGEAISLNPGEDNSGIEEDLNSFFVISGEGYSTITYSFSSLMEEVTRIGNNEVSFSVRDEGTKLYAWIGNSRGELVSSISNTANGNILNYFRGSVADALVNTGEMSLFIKASAVLDSGAPVEATFGGQDHFEAGLVRPVEFASVSKVGFVDGVDFGEKGSYVSIADLLAPVDWRGREFSEYPNYWGYYGVQIGDDPNKYGFEVLVHTDDVQCEISGKRQAILSGMYIVQVDPAKAKKSSDGKYFLVTDPVRPNSTVEIPVNKYGYLMYFNNGRMLTADFKLFVKAKVHYGFGYLDTDWVCVPVGRTNG